LASISPARFARGTIPPLTLPIRSLLRQSRRSSAWTLVSRLRPCPACLRRRVQALPSSQGTLMCLCPALRPRRGTFSRPIRCRCFVPHSRRRRTCAIVRYFRGSFTRLGHSLSTLRAALTSDDARLVSGWWPAFPCGIRTHRAPIECVSCRSALCHFVTSPLSELGWRDRAAARMGSALPCRGRLTSPTTEHLARDVPERSEDEARPVTGVAHAGRR